MSNASSGAESGAGAESRLIRAGRRSWAIIGVLVVAAAALFVAMRLSLVLVPPVLALFPATLLVPVSRVLQRWGLPPGLAAVVTLLGGLLALAAVVGVMVPFVIAEIPQLAESARDGFGEVQRIVASDPLGLGIDGVGDLVEMVRDQVGELGGMGGQALSAAAVAFETIAGGLLLLVVLFFYLKDGPRLVDAVVRVAPAARRSRLRLQLATAWESLSRYFRGQLLVALVDAVAIGIGLAIMKVPLALPLAVLIFFGGLFPLIGAVATGALAVLVALANSGVVSALFVLGLVLLVQQLEGNVLHPFILGSAVSLHPLVVLLSVTAGAVVYGVLGAFLAVPIAAITARVLDLDAAAASGPSTSGA